jgi:meiotically up-regulated gene 157 (Mug157) protein
VLPRLRCFQVGRVRSVVSKSNRSARFLLAVERYIASISRIIRDPVLATLFANCFPNTLDATVQPATFEGKPDTAVLTGDIAAMWLRDSSAQVWPYLPLAAKVARSGTFSKGSSAGRFAAC